MAAMNGYAQVYLSPHLDDVALSCGGRIRQQTEAGEGVMVVTVFAGIPDPDAPLSPYAEELHERWGSPTDAIDRRREEDLEAMALLGAEAVHWPYTDCIYRRTPDGHFPYASEEALWGEIAPMDTGLIAELSARIAALPLAEGSAIYAPLAVRHHVDHRIVRRAAAGAGRALVHYEDFPYAQDWEAVEEALGDEGWREDIAPLSPEALEAKIAAIARYRSQVSTFWADATDMAASLQTFAERIGGGRPAERYWMLDA